LVTSLGRRGPPVEQRSSLGERLQAQLCRREILPAEGDAIAFGVIFVSDADGLFGDRSGPTDELVTRPLVEQAGIAATVRDQALQAPPDRNDICCVRF
jgi:hypothetical protein